MSAHADAFITVRSEGTLLLPDFLKHLAEGDKELPEAKRNARHHDRQDVPDGSDKARRSGSTAASHSGGITAVPSRAATIPPVEADGSRMPVRTALGLINQVLDEVLAEQVSEFDADTRLALAWLEQHGMSEGPYGDAETLSKAKYTSVDALSRDGLLEAKRGTVRLLRRDELPADWNPETDRRLAVWELTQHLIRRLEVGGESRGDVTPQ